MMKQILRITILLISCTSIYAQEALIDSANTAYIKGDYNIAIEKYSELLQDKNKVSADIYYNLGNSYFKKGDYTNAIINYERAKLLEPNNDDIVFNLAMANQHIIDKIQPLPQVFFVRWWNNIINKFTLEQWAIISIISFVVFLILLGVYLFSKKGNNKRIGFSLGLISIVISILSFNFAANHKYRLNNKVFAIITQASVTVKSSPSEGGTSLFVIHEGLKVEIKNVLGNWYEVKLEDGNQGWLQSSTIERI